MRTLALLAMLILTGCAQQPPAPLSSDKARIAFDTAPAERLSAYRLDGELVDGIDFPDLTPGEHELQVRYRFEAPGSVAGPGMMAEPQWRTCIMRARFNGFEAGQTYVLNAKRLGWQSVGSLTNEAGARLADLETMRCGPGA